MSGSERVVLDPNELRADGTAAIDWYFPSPDGRLLAYGISESGSEISTLYVLDVDSGKHLPDTIWTGRGASVVWQPDGSAFSYTRYPAPGTVPKADENYYRKAYHHVLGTDPARDPLVAGEGRPKEEWLALIASKEDRFLFQYRSLDWSQNDLFVRPIAGGEWTPVAVGLDGRTEGDAIGDQVVLLTGVGAPRYRVVAAPVATPGPEHWRVVVPEGEGVIRHLVLAGGLVVVHRMTNAHSAVEAWTLEGTRVAVAPLPALGTVSDLRAGQGAEVYFAFESYVFPEVVARWDLGNGFEVVERPEIDFAFDDYETEQVWFASKDGTRIPMFVVHRKGLAKDGTHAALLHGYGGFNIAKTPTFQRDRLVWLARGGVYAEACLRGGGEFGRAWHQAGRLENKQNVFDDFVAAGEALIRFGYASPNRLAIDGRSNGGLLTGACLTQRPDLYRAVVVGVPLLDMLRYQDFQIARLWIPEYGSSENEGQFAFLRAYSPYHNVRAGVPYPATLLHTGDTDSRVDPMHARKMTALLQSASGGDGPILLRVDRSAGHGQGKPITKKLEESADVYTFLLWQTGLLRVPSASSSRTSSAPVR